MTTLTNTILQGDALTVLRTVPDEAIDCIITSPPYYGLRNYGNQADQLGLEQSPHDYLDRLLAVFAECYRVLTPTGTLWVNIGDSYAGSGKGGGNTSKLAARQLQAQGKISLPVNYSGGIPRKSLMLIPQRLALGLQDDGWIIRNEVIWNKPVCMPESVKDRCTRTHETIWLAVKQSSYFYDADAIREPSSSENKPRRASLKQDPYRIGSGNDSGLDGCIGGAYRNKRDVWTVNTGNFPDSHFATFPMELIEPMMLAGCPTGGIVLDPFMGAGTTALAAIKHNRQYLGIELHPDYIALANERIQAFDPYQSTPVGDYSQLSLFQEQIS